MESESFEDITKSFDQIDIQDLPDSEKNDIFASTDMTYYKYVPKQIFPHQEPEYIDFELYIKENCENKIKVLNRETFTQIQRPIVIFFHHFREKCAYLSKWLDIIYQLVLKYGDRIEFIAADIYDIDVIYPRSNPINFYRRIVRPKKDSPKIYVIDEKKRIHQHFEANILQ
ncbi:hypothetical protein FF38_12971 [Lucilia cuprina]|uniref:Thioredoxin domain-containing protein n=1 Tax=Lucilia cuprina TaxID=7375 RepID=A0A0L0BZQ2_LUCCU|nr:hypothetical protein FF38_12971 [Lucilia cuprina]